MEATETVNNPDQILERILQQNKSLRESLLKDDCQDDKTAAYLPRLIPLLQGLIKALLLQLEQTTKMLQNTYQLVNTLQDKCWQETSSPAGNNLTAWLLEFDKHILHTTACFGEIQNKLLQMSNRKTSHVQLEPRVSKCDAEKQKLSDMQEVASALPSFRDPLLMPEKDNGIQPRETEGVEMENMVSLNEKVSGQEQEYTSLIESEGQSLPEESVSLPSKDKRKGSHPRKRSAKKISKNIHLQGIPEKNTVVPGELKNVSVQHLGVLHHQLRKTEGKESMKEAENGTCRPIEKHNARDKEVTQIEKRNENARSNQEFGSTRSKDLCEISSINLTPSKPEEEWINKEFLVEVNGVSEPELACCIAAPSSLLENLVVRSVNGLSSLLVDDSEELVSNVISIEGSLDGQAIVSPITIAIPFTSCYRGLYKDITVKVTDRNFQSNYLTPISLEGNQGNHKRMFAEVKTCQLGIFSVVSCLKLETFTIPRKGVSQKLSMDARISLNYPPLTFSSRVTIKLKVQPIEPSLVSVLKTKYDSYHPVVSTSPLVHIQHPPSQPFNKLFTVILPCPPNPEKKRDKDELDHRRATSASIHKVTTVHRIRAMSASPRKHGEKLNESLKLLGCRSKEEGWVLLDHITVRNAQNGLVSFELDEHLDSFIVVRLSSVMTGTHLVQCIQDLENAIHSTMVKMVLQRKKEDPYKIVVLLVPSKDLNLELQSLREEGYSGPPEPSQQFQLREGEQVHFRFSGNIFASDDEITFGNTYKLIFHAQRTPRLALQIKEVDEFGNYSSPHYKGTALFYKVSKEVIAKNVEQPVLPTDYYQNKDLLCKLTLTLPKKEKLINRPPSTRISTDLAETPWDNLFYWLSEELSEENAASLVHVLPLHRSTLQLIKLRFPDNLAEQTYELLSFWKRNLPRSANKLQLLSRCLHRSGRSDLAQVLWAKFEDEMWGREKTPWMEG